MSEDLKLSLHDNREKSDRNILLTVIIFIILGISIVHLFLYISKKNVESYRGNLSGSQLEKLALKLEKRNLALPAAKTWIEYVEIEKPGDRESAQVWYRVGKLYQEAGEYVNALNAYFRSESIYKIESLEDEISRRASDCLESLGKFAAMRSELEKRTALSASDSVGGEEIVAEIGNWKVSRADLDMLIESEIEFQISQLASNLTMEERRAQKKELLESVFEEGRRAEWLQRFIAEELLYREAVKEGFQQKHAIRKLIRNIERKVLAQEYLAANYQSIVRVDESDLRNYYDSHKEEFKKDGDPLDFDEVKDQVYMKVRSQREMEVQGDILQRLRDKYDVVVHHSKLGNYNKLGE